MLIRGPMTGLAAVLIFGMAADAQEPGAPGRTRMVDLDGYAVRVLEAGLDRRRPGEPLVVFEAGATNPLDVWSGVLPQVAERAPVLAYDRAGLGRSEWDGERPTPQRVSGRLRRLLREIGAEPPYVLVGFSWGGVLSRYFAADHPDEVAGIVFVDPGPIVTQTAAETLAPFDSVGAGRAGYDAFWNGYQAFFSGKYPPPPPGMTLPFDPVAHHAVDVRHRVKMLREWALASSRGTLVLSNDLTHAIPSEDPDLVAWAVERVLAAIAAAPHREPLQEN